MRRKFASNTTHNGKLLYYVLLLALILGVCVVAMQDIQIPTTRVTQDIAVNIE